MSRTPVEDYLATLPPARRARIAALYDAVRAQVPAAVETTKYAMPCLAVRGKGLLAVMSTARHVGL